MSKELSFGDGYDEVKYLDNSTNFDLVLTVDGLAFNLTQADKITVKIANDNGYIMEKDIDPSTITNPQNGEFLLPVDDSIMSVLVPDDYYIEVWLEVNPVVPTTDDQSVTLTVNDNSLEERQSIFPSTGLLGFTIDENINSDTGEVIPVITFDQFQDKFNDMMAQMQNVVSNGLKGDKGDKGDPGEGLDIKGQVTSVSALPTTASEGDGYLVNEELYVYTNGAWKDCGPIQGPQGIQGIQGKTGTGISSTTIQYQISNSATTIPTGTWSNTLIATTQDSPFLWTQATLNYDDGTSKSFYLVSSKGDKGDTGAKGQSVWSFPFNIGANMSGRWWSDLKPTPTTDNPPKVGDTIVDLIGNVYQITNVVVGTTQEGGGTFDFGNLLTSIKGPKGDTGPVGAGLAVKGTVSNASQLPTSGNQEGYCYFVGTDLYVWDAGAWKNCGSVSPDLSNYVTVTDLNNGLSTKVSVTDMRKPASDVVGLEDVPQALVRTDLTDKTDLDTVTTSGIYPFSNIHFVNFIDTVQHWGYLEVVSQGEIVCQTIYIDYASNTCFQRKQVGSPAIWTTWVELADYSKVVHIADMRKPASDVAGIEEVNTKQDKISYTPADDSKVLHSTITQLNSTDMNTISTAGFYSLNSGTNGMPNADAWTLYQVIPLSYFNGVQLAYETNSTVLGMRSWNTTEGITFSNWIQFADDSKVAHLSGANNFDTVPTVNNNPLLLASSLPSDLARLGQDQEYTGKNTFDTAPIDKTTGNPYITKDGVPAIPSTLADTTKLANFTDGLQKSGVDVATTTDVTNAINAIASNSINWTSLSVDSSQISDTDYVSNQTNCSYRISHNTLYISGQYVMSGNGTSSHNSGILFELPTNIVSQISFPSTNKFSIGLLQAMAQQASMIAVNLTSDGKITCVTNPYDLNTTYGASMAPGFINAAIPLN